MRKPFITRFVVVSNNHQFPYKWFLAVQRSIGRPFGSLGMSRHSAATAMSTSYFISINTRPSFVRSGLKYFWVMDETFFEKFIILAAAVSLVIVVEPFIIRPASQILVELCRFFIIIQRKLLIVVRIYCVSLRYACWGWKMNPQSWVVLCLLQTTVGPPKHTALGEKETNKAWRTTMINGAFHASNIFEKVQLLFGTVSSMC